MKTESLVTLKEEISSLKNLLIVQDLDGVCIPLVKDPLTRKIEKKYLQAATKLNGSFFVLTNGEHEGKRGVNRLVEKAYKNNRHPAKHGLYLPGLAAGGIQLQDKYGKVTTPGVTNEEIGFLSELPILLKDMLDKSLIELMPQLSLSERKSIIDLSVLDTELSPTINLNKIFSIIKNDIEMQVSVQIILEEIMNKVLDISQDKGLIGSFFLHIAPNLGNKNGKEIIKYASKDDIGTTDIQFLLSGALKEAGLLCLINNYIFHNTGKYPFGSDYNVRSSPKSIESLVDFTYKNISREDMPLIVGVGDTVTSKMSKKQSNILRGGSDRGFLTLIQELGKKYEIKNRVLLVDSSGGEVCRPKINSLLPEGITDINDPLKFTSLVSEGPDKYIEWFIELAESRN